ncbi:MarR family transcriptional regulator [Neorhizobium huautlense]|uniref:MarR family winged helix-turn-helix transcriptional regulator n=1 Tax=Neorhizobium huautlense TaxID=67774 RepID=UPI000CFA1810
MLSNSETVELIPFSTTLLVRDTCLCLHVQRAARALARRFDTAMKPIGLTNGQFSLMMALNRPQPATMGQVASVLAMDRTTLTAALKVLERRGLVKSENDPKDRRGKLLKLTADGMSMLSAALPIWKRVHAEIDAELGDGGSEGLRKRLVAVK